MPADIADGDSVQVRGSGSSVYTLKNSGGVYSCTCPAWMHQGLAIEKRTCKHLRAYRGDEAETLRLGSAALTGRPARPKTSPANGSSESEVSDEGPPVLLAHKWENDVELTGWWISEKLDGVRAYWDGAKFLSRLGNQFFAPPWFTEKLPRVPLDGELWGGRKLFQRTVGIVKRQDESPLWKELKYVVFDAPQHGGVFEERVAYLSELLAGASIPWVEACEHVICRGVAHLKEELARVEGLGGEGLMMRQPRSRYEAGRSSTLLKVKSFHDTEARVVDHVPGMGRHKGRLGALLVELADGTRFNVGTGFSDAERESPPKIGAIITFRYQELSNAGVPRFPSFVGERIDGRFPSSSAAAPVRRVEAIEEPARSPSSLHPAPHQPPRGSMPTRRFEMTEADSRYFWEIETNGSKQKIRFGTFEEKEKLFEDDDEARENAEKKIAEKVAKGFKEVSSATAAKKPSPFDDEEDDEAAAAPAPKPAARPAPTPSAPAPAPVPAPAAAAKNPTGARYFEFVEGTSSKFWEIRVEGSKFFTRYGKIGTDGQTTQKDWDTPERAQAEAAKLLSEKVKKGYQEK